MIPNCIPELIGKEADYVAQAIADGWIAVGPQIGEFEKRVAAFAGARHAVAVNSGTAALHLALVCAGVGVDDEVVVPALTFAASANAVRHCGAFPVFADSETTSLGLDPDQLRDFLASGCERRGDALVNRATGRRVAAVMPVHLYGHPVDLDLITAVAEEFGLALVEDGAEALGAKYKGKMLGATSRLFGLSFNGNKIITTGGGGMVLTSDDDIAKRLRYLSAQSRDDKVEFAHGEVGYNYRMPNLCAAFGLGQFEAIDTLLARKRAIANRYRDALMDIDGVDVRGEANWAENSQWMSILTLDGAKFPEGSAPLRQALVAGVVEARPIWQPLHRQKAFAGCHALTIERAEAVYRAGMCLPCSTGLTDADQDRVIAVIREHLEGVS